MNLQKSRLLFAVTACLFLVLCHVGYLYSYSQGRQQEFAKQIDQQPIQLLSLLILAGVIVFAVLRSPDEEESA